MLPYKVGAEACMQEFSSQNMIGTSNPSSPPTLSDFRNPQFLGEQTYKPPPHPMKKRWLRACTLPNTTDVSIIFGIWNSLFVALHVFVILLYDEKMYSIYSMICAELKCFLYCMTAEAVLIRTPVVIGRPRRKNKKHMRNETNGFHFVMSLT